MSDDGNVKLPRDTATRIHWWMTHLMQGVMAVFLAGALVARHWLDATVVAAIMAIIYSPRVLGKRFRVFVPPEFELLAILFVFASLFLGEVRGYYVRYWWWDIALHTASGLLLGILGFLLVYVLNESDDVDLRMKPRFVALFAFFFAVGTGALWEIFEFSMDRLVGTNMQKPMFNDPSGLTDTMWDLVVDTVGALIISLWGWWWMLRPEDSFIERWVRRFVAANPHLFAKAMDKADGDGI